MKELYISPELEILCFLPVQGIATASWGTWANGKSDLVDDGLSTGEGNDYDTPVEDIEPLN